MYCWGVERLLKGMEGKLLRFSCCTNVRSASSAKRAEDVLASTRCSSSEGKEILGLGGGSLDSVATDTTLLRFGRVKRSSYSLRSSDTVIVGLGVVARVLAVSTEDDRVVIGIGDKRDPAAREREERRGEGRLDFVGVKCETNLAPNEAGSSPALTLFSSRSDSAAGRASGRKDFFRVRPRKGILLAFFLVGDSAGGSNALAIGGDTLKLSSGRAVPRKNSPRPEVLALRRDIYRRKL